AEIVRARRQETDDRTNQFGLAFDLEPRLGAQTRQIAALQTLGDNTLKVLPARLREEYLAATDDGFGKNQTRMLHLTHQLGEPFAAFDQGPREQRLIILV